MITNNTFNGIAEIIVYDKQSDGSLIETKRHKQHNKILIRVIEKLLNRERVFSDVYNVYTGYRDGANRYDGGVHIGIFVNQEPESFDRRQADALATGDRSLISDSYIRTQASDTEPANVVYKQRFLAPTEDRTFYSLGLIETTYAWQRANDNPWTHNILTYILLNTPIDQTTNQVLDINYKVFIDWENSTTDANYNAQREIEKLFLGEVNGAGESIGFEKNQFIHGTIVDDPGTHLFNHWVGSNNGTYTQILGYLSRYQDTFNLTDRYGASGKPFSGGFAKGIQYGGVRKHDPTLPSYLGRDYFNKTSNLSSVYSHSVGADKPMYDANKLANSSWQPVISDDNTVKEFPAHYIVKVSKAGGIGVGEYKLYKTGHQGWSGNRYTEAIGVPFLNFDMSLYYVNRNKEGVSFNTDFDCYNHRWNYTWSYASNEHYFVSYVRDKGVALFKLTSESLELVKRYKLADNPDMNYFIEDIEVIPEDNLIYIATAGGLYKVDTTTDTITQESSDRCMCVVTGYQGKTFGVFIDNTDTGRISSSDDYTTALPDGITLTSSDLPNYLNTWRLFIDKESPNYEMVLIQGFNTKGKWHTLSDSRSTVYWMYWRNETEFVKKDAINGHSKWSHYMSVSDLMCFPSNNSIICDNGVWIYPIRKYHAYSWHQVRYQFNFNHGVDLKQDFINTGWRTREARYYDWAATGQISEDDSLYTFPTNSSSSRHVVMGSRIGLSKFAETGNYIGTFYTHMDTPGALFKGYENEGNQYKIQILLEHWVRVTSPHYNPNTGGGSLAAWPEGDREPSTNQWDGNQFGAVSRLAYFVDIDLDLDTNTSVINVKGGDETTSRYSLRSYSHPDFGSLRRTSDKQIIMFPRVGTVCSRGFYMLSPFRYPDNDLKDTFIQAYSWDSINSEWVKDHDNTGEGKPLHTDNQPLVNGLSIAWQDLLPSDSQDLVLDQYYNFVRTTPDYMIPIEDHTPSFSFYYWWSYRRRVATTTQQVVPSNRILFVPEAPDGTAPDPEWKGLSNSGLLIKVSLDGSSIGISENGNTNPPAGTAWYHRSLGRFYFNSADVGKTADITYTYYLKYDNTES